MHKLVTHDCNNWNCVNAAMGKTTTGLTKVADDSFFMNCETFLDPLLTDSSPSNGVVSCPRKEALHNLDSKKIKIEERLGVIAELSKHLFQHMNNMSERQERSQQLHDKRIRLQGEKDDKRLDKQEKKEKLRIQREQKRNSFLVVLN